MNKTSKKIDRGTLLKGSGAAAFLAMLATATAEAKVKCCEPGDDGFGFKGGGKKAHKLPKNYTPASSVLIMKGQGNSVPSAPPGYTQTFVITDATGFGHVLDGRNDLQNNMTGKDIYVFIKP